MSEKSKLSGEPAPASVVVVDHPTDQKIHLNTHTVEKLVELHTIRVTHEFKSRKAAVEKELASITKKGEKLASELDEQLEAFGKSVASGDRDIVTLAELIARLMPWTKVDAKALVRSVAVSLPTKGKSRLSSAHVFGHSDCWWRALEAQSKVTLQVSTWFSVELFNKKDLESTSEATRESHDGFQVEVNTTTTMASKIGALFEQRRLWESFSEELGELKKREVAAKDNVESMRAAVLESQIRELPGGEELLRFEEKARKSSVEGKYAALL